MISLFNRPVVEEFKVISFWYYNFILFSCTWKLNLCSVLYNRGFAVAGLFGQLAAASLVIPHWYWVGPPFAFRIALILRSTDSARCWKHYSKVLVRVDVIVLFKWISWYQSVLKKIHLHHLWAFDMRRDGSMHSRCLCQILTLPSKCFKRNQDSPAGNFFFFSSFYCPILVSLCKL